MSEPSRRLLRPTTMTISAKTTALLSCGVLLMTGCGDAGGTGSASGDTAGGSSDSSASPSSAASPQVQTSDDVAGCAADSREVSSAKALTRADVDGDGTPDQVSVTAAGGTCGSVVFARVADGFVVAEPQPDEPAVQPQVGSAYAVTLPGRDGQLVVTRADVMRGGFQLEVYAAGEGGLVELRPGGRSLLPFIATDAPAQGVSVDCGEDGTLVQTEAVAHEPAGVMPAWDIRRTTYTLDGTTLTASGSEEVADNVLATDLETKYPELTKFRMFESCRAG